jgi:hypothetical protein
MDVSSVALFSYLLDDLYGLERPQVIPEVDILDNTASPDAVVRYKLRTSLMKKLNDVVAVDADDRCLEKFLDANLRSENWQLNCRDNQDVEMVGNWKRFLDDFFFPGGELLWDSYFDLLKVGRAGPGASLGANGEDFFTKFFASRLTTTSSFLYDTYNEFVGWFPTWRDAEISRAITHGNFRLTRSSSITFVRKTRDISRSICTEPSLNMFFQLGLGAILESRLRSAFGISFDVQQERNRKLACRGSLDDSVSTLDLESASDCVSLNLCSFGLPQYVFDTLLQLRTPYTKVRNCELKLNMVSTMGNGFTFPLQTILFCCVVQAAARQAGFQLTRADAEIPNWGVFGDDIICPRLIAPQVIRLLDLLGFLVNGQKSYVVGPFRESCGADFFKGVNVRGVYLKTLLTPQSRYVAINLLNEWSARTGIPLPRAVGYLVDSVKVLAIPAHEQPDSGIRVPFGLIEGKYYSSKKQRFFYRCYEPIRTVLSIDDLGNVATPSVRGKRIKRRTQNPFGLWVAFIAGYVRNMKILLPLKQGEEPSYRTRGKVSPYWGPSPEQLSLAGGWDFWKRWNSAVDANLTG